MTDKTLSFYLSALRRLFVIEDVPAWQLSLRSKIAIRTTKKTLNSLGSGLNLACGFKLL